MAERVVDDAGRTLGVPSNPMRQQQVGPNGEVDLRGESTNRPAASSLPAYSTFWSLDTGAYEYTNGSEWKPVGGSS